MTAEHENGVLSVQCTEQSERTVITVAGELDAATAHQLRAIGLEAVRLTDAPVRVDVREVSFIDSQGLAALLAIFKQATGRSLDFSVLCGPEETPPSKLLRLVGLERALGVHRHES
jgi:anti-anti-sigma factor